MAARSQTTLGHPFQRIPPAQAGAVFVAFFVLTVALIAVMGVIDAPLKTPPAPNGIIDFELARTVEHAGAIVQSWQEALATPFAGFSLGIDYLFMLAYATAIALGCVWASRMVDAAGWPLAAVGVVLAWAQGVAALCDATENAALLVLLLVKVAAPWPQIAWAVATVKFGLVILGLLYAAYGAAAWLAQRGRQPRLAH